MTKQQRVLCMAHGHPKHSKGGAEIAAYELYRAYGTLPDVEAAYHLTCADTTTEARGRMSTIAQNEFQWQQNLSNMFLMQAQNRFEVNGYFSEFLRYIKPTIVHTHHYFRFGLEYLRAIKRVDSDIVTLLTLHEYMAICPNKGLMKSPAGQLCASGHYLDHLKCDPEATPESLWLRRHRFRRYFDFVDYFVCPSAFLKDRYTEWGIPSDRMVVQENGQATLPKTWTESDRKSNPNRFGFFGQINEHKGLDVVLRAISRLSDEKRNSIRLDVNGANLERQPRAFQRLIQSLAAPLVEAGIVNWRGSYQRENISQRMADVDWVIVPSIWYENSPLVIQEAFTHGKPVIASDLGALPEKLCHGTAGLVVPAGDSDSWARHLIAAANDADRWYSLRASLPSPPTISDAARDCVDLANTVMNERAL